MSDEGEPQVAPNRPPIWLRVVLGIGGAVLLAYAALQLYRQAAGGGDAAVVVAIVLVAWVAVAVWVTRRRRRAGKGS